MEHITRLFQASARKHYKENSWSSSNTIFIRSYDISKYYNISYGAENYFLQSHVHSHVLYGVGEALYNDFKVFVGNNILCKTVGLIFPGPE